MNRKISELILTAGPLVDDIEINNVLDAAKNGWNNNHSDYLYSFQDKVAKFCNVRYAMATSSCTGAMHTSLLALGIGPGDEVIVPELTWLATAAVVTYVGATPVFCDVDQYTWNMCPKSVESLITKKTKAIMPVHLYGQPCDMDSLWNLAKKYNLKILEDTAQAIGATYKGKKTGSLGDMGCFSFQGAKAIVTGEGGIFVTDNEEFYKKGFWYNDQCRDPSKTLYCVGIGVKYKMSNLQAAFGCGQIDKVNEMLKRKEQIFRWYQERLGDINEIQLNPEVPDIKNIFWMSTMILGDKIKIERDDFMKELRNRMIDSRPTYTPLSSLPMFDMAKSPNAQKIGLRGINLPSGVARTEEEVDYICKNIRELLGKGLGKCSPVLNGHLAYRELVRDKLKEAKVDPEANKIEIISDKNTLLGYLKPIGKDSIGNKDDIQLLADWRQKNLYWIPSYNEITFDGTAKWLEKGLVGNPDRILYWVVDLKGKKIGHIGLFRFNYFEKSCELDNSIRGDSEFESIFPMYFAYSNLIKYAFSTLNITDMYAIMFDDNENAIKMNKNCGFQELNRIALKEVKLENGLTVWDKFHDHYRKADRYEIFMKMDRNIKGF